MVYSTEKETKKKLDADHLLELESLKVEPDQLVSYFFWAEDVGPDGETRRVESDMFFAEVRPFEEIFREGTTIVLPRTAPILELLNAPPSTSSKKKEGND